MDTAIKIILVIFTLLVAVVFGWGLVGGMQAQDPGVTCDMGLGETLCWKWHTNPLGQINQFINDLSDNSR